jgi:hypothetical protein
MLFDQKTKPIREKSKWWYRKKYYLKALKYFINKPVHER